MKMRIDDGIKEKESPIHQLPDKNKLEFTSSKNSSLVIWPIYLSNFYPITIVTKLQFTILY